MNKEWLELIIQQLHHIYLNSGKTTKIKKIRVKSKKDEYNCLLKKHQMRDIDIERMSKHQLLNNMEILDANLDIVDKLEHNYLMPREELENFFSYNLLMCLDYKKMFCLDVDNKIYRDMNYIQKNKLRIIGNKIHSNIPLLKNKGIHKHKKLHHIKKLNKAIKHFINESEELDSHNIEQIITRIKKIKIKHS